MSVNPSYSKDTVAYRGKDAADKFLDKLQKKYKAITEIQAEVKPRFRNATCKYCHIYRKKVYRRR